MNYDNKEIFLTLLRLGIGHQSGITVPNIVDWGAIETLAVEQGLSAVMVDGIERLPDEMRPPKLVLLQWIGETLKSYEYRYDAYKKTIAEIAEFYNTYGFRMMVLKGYACALDWPRPEHRPCGDIDIWLFGKQNEADKILSKEKGIEIDRSHHHHTIYYWNDFMVENHYDFDNVHAHRSNKDIEVFLKELGTLKYESSELRVESQLNECSNIGCKFPTVVLEDTSTGSATKIYLPSPNLHALFLLRHMSGHFSGAKISLRQVLDWAFFVEKHTSEIDWEWLINLLEKYHMKDFYNCINAICVEDLGFPIDIFPKVQFIPELKKRVLEDILNPEYSAAEPRDFLPRVIYKYKRWQGNAWKQEMCYGESRWSAFWTGIWAKILKPASI